LQLVDLPYSDECCGFRGVFSIEHPEISAAMPHRKISNIEASRAAWVVSCDAGYSTNIHGGLPRRGLWPRALHIAEMLKARHRAYASLPEDLQLSRPAVPRSVLFIFVLLSQ
jgi:Fe-S oxidoreductase